MVVDVRSVREGRGNACASCATLPDARIPEGSLSVTTTSVDHRLLVAEVLEGLGLTPVHGMDDRLTCPVPPADLPAVAPRLVERLAP